MRRGLITLVGLVALLGAATPAWATEETVREEATLTSAALDLTVHLEPESTLVTSPPPQFAAGLVLGLDAHTFVRLQVAIGGALSTVADVPCYGGVVSLGWQL